MRWRRPEQDTALWRTRVLQRVAVQHGLAFYCLLDSQLHFLAAQRVRDVRASQDQRGDVAGSNSQSGTLRTKWCTVAMHTYRGDTSKRRRFLIVATSSGVSACTHRTMSTLCVAETRSSTHLARTELHEQHHLHVATRAILGGNNHRVRKLARTYTHQC